MKKQSCVRERPVALDKGKRSKKATDKLTQKKSEMKRRERNGNTKKGKGINREMNTMPKKKKERSQRPVKIS